MSQSDVASSPPIYTSSQEEPDKTASYKTPTASTATSAPKNPPAPSKRTFALSSSSSASTSAARKSTGAPTSKSSTSDPTESVVALRNAHSIPIPPSHEEAVAEAVRKMQEAERKKKEERKRKRDEEEKFTRAVKAKIDEESIRVEKELDESHGANRELYALFNDLQGISQDFGLQFETPELVVVGMQSDGKSSFIEALLGFQFNIVETNIGTRRPLILQMINNTEKETPSCRFRKEHTSLPTIVDDVDKLEELQFEPGEVPVDELVDEIMRRTQERAGKGEGVSNVPIILRVEYAHCSNLTIYDTPGFRLGGKEKLSRDIQQMVEKLMQPKNRIIVCLEQSTVEWANSTSRPIARKVDPDFLRTVLINTKFDNRVKELRHAEAANKHLAGENLPPHSRPFFISLPVRRNLDSDRFRTAIKDAYLEDYHKLLEVHFDEERFFNQIGFFKAKSYMEQLLSQKYYTSVAPTLRTLDNLCKDTEREIAAIKRELESTDIETLKHRVNAYLQSFVQLIERLLEGSIIGDPDVHGQTLDEEKVASGVADWSTSSNFDLSVFDVQNASYRIYGGAQYARLLNEFEYVAHSREFPATSINEVAAAIGTSKYHNVPVYETAASDIVQIKARAELQPLIDIVMGRCSYIIKRLCDVAVSVLKTTDVGVMNVYDNFLRELKSTFDAFVDEISADCRNKLRQVDAFTTIVDWDLISGFATLKDYDYLESNPQATKERVTALLQTPTRTSTTTTSTDSGVSGVSGPRTRRVDSAVFREICMMAGKLFAGVRFFFVKYVRSKLNAFFLEPLFQRLAPHVLDHFRRLATEATVTMDQSSDATSASPKFEQLFVASAAELRQRLRQAESRLVHLSASRDRFRQLHVQLAQRAQPNPSPLSS